MKNFDEIECPQCGTAIPISEALRLRLTEHIREEVGQREKDLLIKEKELRDKEEGVEKRVAKEVADAVSTREVELKKREDSVAAEEKTIEERVQTTIEQERKKLQAEAKKKAEEEISLELKDAKTQLLEKDQKLKEAEKTELELRKRERELVEKERHVELETERRIATEREKIQEEASKAFEEEHRLKDAEKDKKLQDAIKANDELRRKLQQGSQQTQGEVLELEIEDLINTNFLEDRAEPVPKGVNGADVVHRIFNRHGDECGVIVWESKHTKAWSDAWIQKLKDDLLQVKGDLAILVSEVLPKGMENFGLMNGIWVTEPACALGLVTALRVQLIEVTSTKLAAVGKNEKMEFLYRYISGSEFRQHVGAIVDAFVEMQKDLQAERRVAESRWSKREKQIQRVIANTAGMYGDFQGLIGSSLEAIPALTMGEGDEDSKEASVNVEDSEIVKIEDIPF